MLSDKVGRLTIITNNRLSLAFCECRFVCYVIFPFIAWFYYQDLQKEPIEIILTPSTVCKTF